MHIMSSVRSLLLALAIVFVSAASSFAQFGISITIAPPALPVYEQPICPGDGYLWAPGYWAYGDDYYWVPGTWTLAPTVGLLWTPPYWGWGGGGYLFHAGYWGPHVGFYGGISYGFGYFGSGFEGGRWDGGHFFYNRSVTNVNVTNIHNTYNTTIVHNTVVNRVSYNGGNGGVEARPTREEEAVEREPHIPPTSAQTAHVQAARSNPELRASANQGKPPIAATSRPGEFREGAVPAREAGAPYNRGAQPAANRPESNVPRPPVPADAKDLSPHPRPAAPNTGDTKVDQKYQQQQDKLYAKQQQDHQKLAQQQEQEHQRLAQQNGNDARKQWLEQKHQQQTQQMEQRHDQQQQRLQTRQQAANRGGGSRPR